jgi:alanyl-tRNA synthetase
MKRSVDPHMHSAEHLLNQTMVRKFGCGRCFSAHIERKKSKCDYRFGRPMTEAEAREIEAEVNKAIAADLPVTETRMPLEAAAAEFDLGRLPENAGDTVRIIRMGDYDACPCIGEHVASTGEIPKFRITTTSFDDGVLRVRFKLARAGAGK